MTNSHNASKYQASKDLLKGRIIAVTGAGDGIGREAAKTFASLGATVILLGRTTAKLEKVYDEIEAEGGPQAAIYPINFEGAVEKDYDDMHNTLASEFGLLDGLLHNASELGERTPIGNYPVEVWERVLHVNITAPFMMTKALLPLLERSQHGSIVFTGSGVGLHGRAYWGAYAVSKAATENLMQLLADELENTTSVRVNSINPGAIRSTMRAQAFPAEDPNTLKTAKDIMPLYLYLLGKDSIGVSGCQFDAQPNEK